MKAHFCPIEKTLMSYEGECNWCGQKEPVAYIDNNGNYYPVRTVNSMLEGDKGLIPLYRAEDED